MCSSIKPKQHPSTNSKVTSIFSHMSDEARANFVRRANRAMIRRDASKQPRLTRKNESQISTSWGHKLMAWLHLAI